MFVAGKKMIVEKLWQEFFVDPSQWWDNRPEKADASILISSIKRHRRHFGSIANLTRCGCKQNWM